MTVKFFSPSLIVRRSRLARAPVAAGLLALGIAVAALRHDEVMEVHPSTDAERFPLALAPATADDWPELRSSTGTGGTLRENLIPDAASTGAAAWDASLSGPCRAAACLRRGLAVAPDVDLDRGTISLRAFDAEQGALVWTTPLFQGLSIPRSVPSRIEMPACDGQSVFLGVCVNGRLIVSAVDLQGRRSWQQDVGPLAGDEGQIVSPALAGSLVILAADPPRGWRRRWAPGFLVGVHRQSGEVVWRAARESSEPLTFALAQCQGRVQAVSATSSELAGCDPATGERLWSLPWAAPGIVDAVISDGTRLFLAVRGLRPAVFAVAPSDGEDGPAQVLWQVEAGRGAILSLQATDRSVVALSEAGELISFHAENGKPLWQRQLPGSYAATPVAADSQLLCVNRDGLALVLALDERGKTLVEARLGSGVVGPIVATRDRLLLRTEDGLLSLPWEAADAPLVRTPPASKRL